QASSLSISQTSFVQMNAITNALTARFLALPPAFLASSGVGLAAATPGKRWNAWGNVTGNTTEQDFMRPAPAASKINIDSDAVTTTVGVDTMLSPTMAVGLSASFDRATGSSHANGALQNNLTNKGYALAPYLGVSLSKQWALDASLGWGQGELSQTGNVRAEADRWFAGVNLNYAQWFGETQVAGRLGWYHGEEDYDAAKIAGVAQPGTAAKGKLDQWRLGVQASWWMKGVMPYLGLTYLTERRASSLAGASNPIGKDAWQLSLGAHFLSVSTGVTGGVAFEQEFGRSNQDNYRLIANIGIRF
ncbi:MAG: autotransporter outer membrane beta-barrel domain-containing protein, partial [Rhodocyclaceae bacterium]|nr:autotransporter outer membrane beta-barrel domain-containing protein [Rhodocyclaceae bacterium]